jgi:hypothetical protein
VIEREISAWPAGSKQVVLKSADIGETSELAFTGEATREDGTASGFLGLASLNGSNLVYHDTGAFQASDIAVASDGSIWAIGSRHAEHPSSDIWRWDNYDMLVHFSADGRILDHLLPRWESRVAYVLRIKGNSNQVQAFDAKGTFLESYAAPRWGKTFGYETPRTLGDRPFLKVAAGQVFLYDPPNECLYIYHIAGKRLSHASTVSVLPPSMIATGFGVTEDGAAFVSLTTSDITVTDPPSRIYQLKVKQDSEVLDSVAAILLGGNNDRVSILGTDGNNLVYRSRDKDRLSVVNWSAVITAP